MVDEEKSEKETFTIVREAEIKLTKLVAETNQTQTVNPIVLKEKDLVYKDLHTKIYLSEIAKVLNTTPPHLASLFKKEFGLTVNQFILKEKLIVASNLLCYSKFTIDEIAN